MERAHIPVTPDRGIVFRSRRAGVKSPPTPLPSHSLHPLFQGTCTGEGDRRTVAGGARTPPPDLFIVQRFAPLLQIRLFHSDAFRRDGSGVPVRRKVRSPPTTELPFPLQDFVHSFRA